MIIYNVTCSVDLSIGDEWLEWMREKHIPDVMKCGIFKKARLHKVLSEKEKSVTYCIQYHCLSMKALHKYQVRFATELQEQHIKKYGSKVIAFRTLLEEVDSF